MANITRVRVELGNKYKDPKRNLKDMLHKFRRYVSDAGIIAECKSHQFFESKSVKARRKKNEAIAKAREEMIEEKLFTGDKIKASPGLIKKVVSAQNKKKKKREDKNKNYKE